jgi:hypothetical protein
MSTFKFLGATLVFSALLATPASAWEAISDPGAAEAQDPTFSIYNDRAPVASRAPLGHASGTHMLVPEAYAARRSARPARARQAR